MIPPLQIIENYPGLHMGPTVLFVLGAIQEPIGTAPADELLGREKLRQLLVELRGAQPGHGVRVQWCRDIAAYVATTMPFVDGLNWDVDGSKPPDLERLVGALWARYGEFILAGEFSIEDRVWRRFTLEEVRTIALILGKSPEH